MTRSFDSEAALEAATMQLFASRGWQTADAYYEVARLGNHGYTG